MEDAVFGYNVVSKTFFESYIFWWKKRHNYLLKENWLMFCTGVVAAISSIVRSVTKKDEKVLVLSPIYNIFYNSIINNERKVVESKMIYKDGKYEVDYDDLAKKLSDKDAKLMIFCNPHNPIGKVWELEELKKIGNLCLKNNVLLISDEIHCDLTHEEYRYVPFASVSKNIEKIVITCLSPSKAFNIAGLQTSIISVPNKKIREIVNKGINKDEVAEPNSFAIQVTEAAFNKSERWLIELNKYLSQNRKYLREEINKAFPEIKIVDAQATYLMWLDCQKITDDTKKLCDFIRKKTGLILSDGKIFGGNGKFFIRWNYACPKALLIKGINKFKSALIEYKKIKKEGK